MVNSKGEDTSIIFGFTKYLLEIISKEQPSHFVICFDTHAKTFRHEAYSEYKATRTASPQLVIDAVEPLTKIAEAMHIPVVMMDGYEADDLICSLARKFASSQMDVYMVTPDKDLGQVVDDHIFQYKPGKSGSGSEIVDKAGICSHYGIQSPSQIIDILTIWGDASDNVKGVKGVGEIGAQKLIGYWGSVENIYANLDKLSAKLRENFQQASDYIYLSKFLITIKSDIDLPYSEQDFEITACYDAKVAEIFSHYEFTSLKNMLPKCSGLPEKIVESIKPLVVTEHSFDDILVLAEKTSEIAIIGNDNLCLAVGEAYCFCKHDDSRMSDLLANPFIAKIGFGLKELEKTLLKEGKNLQGELYDIEIMHYLINPERSHRIDYLAKSYLQKSVDSIVTAKQMVQGDLFTTMDDAQTPKEDMIKIAREASACSLLKPLVAEEMAAEGLMNLYLQIEMPLIAVLASMEYEGVKVDVDALLEYGKALSAQLVIVEDEAREMVDDSSLNLASPRQIGVVLFEKLKLDDKAKKNQNNNYSTDEETLSDLLDKHPIVGKILEYRGLRKLISTYIDPFPQLVDPNTGKIHTTFNQSQTATGRLSSLRPNMQNIPIRSEQGQQIRKSFVSSFPGGYIVSADYSQIELRIMAHLSGDEGMIADFLSGHDIHSATAAKIFHVSVEDVSKVQRAKAKTANFGIIYGISAFGLSQRLSISRQESKELIDHYFDHYPGVKTYIENAVKTCRKQGYVETIFGRRRMLPDINAHNANIRKFAERNAVNAPIQGSAADIIKIAMIKVFETMREKCLKSKMVLQVHDELIFDVCPDELDVVISIAKEQMENVCKLSVPLIVDCGKGTNWLEAH